ncbi:hypothetical protein Ga0074812_12140 [Parafrankia irregularis]|uniref:Uncharacterized protein n=1 Tax=Parafrankia irregularis TaxID=795642 RepID=A0A0S4QUY6_9ACTN|nr:MULTISPECIES: hypothetical protein [Parafrankia]MBE3205110.1 hypothetical protein [Parafrankia sp. CH37]CUU58664.1 hypothetical protein Ga0074812_12140 [Parafrankia irregularis]
MTTPAVGPRGFRSTRRARGAELVGSTDWAWPAAWTGSSDWPDLADNPSRSGPGPLARRGGVPRRPDRPRRLRWLSAPHRVAGVARAVAASRRLGTAAQLAGLLLAGVFWGFAAHRMPASVLAADATVALCLWAIVQVARAAVGDTGPSGQLRAGGLAMLMAVALTEGGGWLIPDLDFLRTKPGFLILVPLAAASGALWPGHLGGQRSSRPPDPGRPALMEPGLLMGPGGIGAVAVGLIRTGTLVALVATAVGQVHLALLAWLAPVALAAGPRCGWLLWHATTGPAAAPGPCPAPRGAGLVPVPSGHPRIPRQRLPERQATRHQVRGHQVRRQGIRRREAVGRRFTGGQPAAGTTATGRVLWPAVATGLTAILLSQQADAACASFALAAFAVAAATGPVGDRGPAALPAVAVALVAAPALWASFGPGYPAEGTATLRLLLLALAIDALPAVRATATRPVIHRAGAMTGLIALVALLPLASPGHEAEGYALALLVGRTVAALSAVGWAYLVDSHPVGHQGDTANYLP